MKPAPTTFLLVWLVFAASLGYPQSATIVPQDDSVLLPFTGGKHVKSLQVLAIVVCADPPQPLPGGPATATTTPVLSTTGGSVYAAAVARGFVPLLPRIALAQIAYALDHSRAYYAMEALRVGAVVAGALGGRTLNPTQRDVVNGVGLLGEVVQAHFATRLTPAPGLAESLLDPEGIIDLSRGCRASTIIAQTHKQAAKNARKMAELQRQITAAQKKAQTHK